MSMKGKMDVESKTINVVRCKCGNVICVRSLSDGSVTVKRHGRTITVKSAKGAEIIIICEKCGNKNKI